MHTGRTKMTPKHKSCSDELKLDLNCTFTFKSEIKYEKKKKMYTTITHQLHFKKLNRIYW